MALSCLLLMLILRSIQVTRPANTFLSRPRALPSAMPGIVVDPLDLLEAQIAELERKIIGNVQLSERDEPITESLVNSCNALESAVASYDSVSAVFNRIHELGTYLDPVYEDSVADTVMKTKLVLESEQDIRSMLNQLNKLNAMSEALNPEPFKDIPNLTEKLRQQSEHIIRAMEDFATVEAKTRQLSENFNVAMTTLDRAHQLTAALLTEIEEASRTKKIDRDID